MKTRFRPISKHLSISKNLALMTVPLVALSAVIPPRAYADGPIKPGAQLQNAPDLVGLVKAVKPAVVSITARIRVGADDQGNFDDNGQSPQSAMPFPFPFPFQFAPPTGQRMVEARGSGFIISQDGYVVTNNHVVKNATKVTVTLDDGSSFPAKIIGRDSKSDVALLKIKTADKLPFIRLGNSDNVQPGAFVVAVGNPYGLGGTVTSGIVSALGRDLGAGPYDDFIQVDAPINHGNSGGPLFDQNGDVIGMNTAIISPSGGSIGIGFAIPSNTVKDVVNQLQKTGHVTRGYLGVTVQRISPTMAKALGLTNPSPGIAPTGALVANVIAGGPADHAGIRSGDIITSVNGVKVKNDHDVVMQTVANKPGSRIVIQVLRDGKTQSIKARVGSFPKNGDAASSDSDNADDAGSTKLGVSLSPLTDDIRHQLGVDRSVKGAVVSAVTPGSPAEQAGIRSGDIVQSVDRKPITNPEAATMAVRGVLRKNKPVLLRIYRDGLRIFVAIAQNNSQDDE